MVEIIGNYLLKEKIYESANSQVYRCTRKYDRKPFIIKILQQEYPRLQELTRYKQEYEITRNLNLDGVIKAYDLEPYDNSLAIILEDFGASSLKQLMSESNFFIQIKENKKHLSEFLNLAIKMAETLGQIHGANVIHKDINPSNIVFNSTTKQLKIIDFGLSTFFSSENPRLKHPNILEGTLAYISPEQTGRMNRSLDYRTDFYSLGVTFYELLTGKLPFDTQDAMELVHCQIAKRPLSPYELMEQNDDVLPKIVSDIIIKLMSKTAEKRYQTAWGLKADLEECLQQLQTTGRISDFPLGRQDISDKFTIPQKLYGREKEITTLLTAFERVASGQNTDQEEKQEQENRNGNKTSIEMMLLTGYSGIGKSALVREIYKPITQKRGYFISGKFDQLQRNIPYSAIVNAFRCLIKQLLTESSVKLQQWREKLIQALGVNARVIIDVIPEVELIIGEQSPVPNLGALESQNRFNLVFRNFIRVFCSQEHPLVLFLDDLQWVDSATLKLIKVIMGDTKLQYLFFIGAYRDNEVDSRHPLTITLEELQKQKAIINRIKLAPLTIDCVTQLISESLNHEPSHVKSLAELVMLKTSGNAFFVNQFLTNLYGENLLQFNVEDLLWLWDIKQIEAMKMTDNVVEFMVRKINKLPIITTSILRFGACIGAFFRLNTLSIICQQSSSEIFKNLLPAIHSGLIIPTSELDSQLLIQEYKFSHDRIQQAAYSLMNDSEKKTIHLQIGRLLLAKLSSEKISERIFELVDHLNLGRDLINETAEQTQLLRLNWQAAQKAKKTMAYVAALKYLNIAIEYLNDNSWLEDYQFTFELYQQKSEVEYLNGNYEESENLIKFLLEKANCAIDKADTYNTLILLHTNLAKYKDAIEAGTKGLALLDVDLQTDDVLPALTTSLTEAHNNLGDREIASLANEPEMEIAEKKVAVKLLMNLLPPAYFTDGNLFALISTISSNLCFQYGPIADSAMAYSCYATILIATSQDYQQAYKFGLLAMAISDRFNDLTNKAKSCHIVANHIVHWVKPSQSARAINDEGYKVALESGNIQSAGYIAHHIVNHRLFEGENLEEILTTLPDYLQFVSKPKNIISYNTFLAHQLAILNLTANTENLLSFNSPDISEKEYIENAQLDKDEHSLCIFYILKCQALYLHEEYDLAWVFSSIAEQKLPFIACLLPESDYNFYASLTLLALYPQVDASEQEKYLTKVKANQGQMKIWSENCPYNFQQKYLLVEAQLAQIAGKDLEAMELYDRGVACAGENKFVQDEALGNELTAKFWLSKGKNEIAQIYFKKAYYGYQLWGAKRKLEKLEHKYPNLFSNQKTADINRITSIRSETSDSNNSSALDLKSVIKASQALAGEIVLDKLLTKLITIVIENAGAQKGFLILKKEDNWFIEAQGKENEDDDVIVLQSIPINLTKPDPESVVSIGIINYVCHTRENIVLSDAREEERFIRDPYIANVKPKSVLCTPLLNQGKLNGILYLENNLSTGVFTPERVEILRILSVQAAISIENSRLYKQLEDYSYILEQKVKQRTNALIQANQELERLASLDGLTQVANRRYFEEYIIREWQRVAREQAPLSLILFDVDFFKKYNDCYGHQDGDQCLIKIAQAAKKSIQRSNDLVARYGGEEFVVVLPNTDLQGAITIAKRIQENLRELQIPHCQSQVNEIVTISLGVACTIPQINSNHTQLVKEADSALYKAKEKGRNTYCIYKVEDELEAKGA